VPRNANAREAVPGAPALNLGKDTAVEHRATTEAGQVVVDLPPLAAARARLLELIRSRPAPQPNYRTAADEARLARRSRLADAQRILRPIVGNVTVATAIGVSTRTILHWRAGTRHPSVRFWRRARALHALLGQGGRS
jgi:hypothetical protein